MNICVYGAASSLIDKSYIEAGEELGRRMAKRGHRLIFGGGSNGMMGAVARGVTEENGVSVGVIPRFFQEAGAEISYDKCTEYIYTDTMNERKLFLEYTANAFIITPGGIGTFDEFFQALTLKQLGRHNKPMVIFDINGFYDEFAMALQKMVDQKFITDDCAQLCKVSQDIDEILDYIENYDQSEIDISNVKIR